MSTQAADHDFRPSATVTPFGILLPQYHQLSLALVTSKLTAECIVVRLEA
ncbi:MAG: hypothetical protein AAF722_17090 [Cyanobacteria bacterium P01_C01_bin.70]